MRATHVTVLSLDWVLLRRSAHVNKNENTKSNGTAAAHLLQAHNVGGELLAEELGERAVRQLHVARCRRLRAGTGVWPRWILSGAAAAFSWRGGACCASSTHHRTHTRIRTSDATFHVTMRIPLLRRSVGAMRACRGAQRAACRVRPLRRPLAPSARSWRAALGCRGYQQAPARTTEAPASGGCRSRLLRAGD